MNIGVLTSGFFHLLFGVLLLINIESLMTEKREAIQSVKVAVISKSDYTKLISEDEIKKSEPLETEPVNILKPPVEKKQTDEFKKNKIKPLGNELVGLSEPKITKVQKRKTPGEIITEVAQGGQNESNPSENFQVSVKNTNSLDKFEPEKKNKKTGLTTTVISPDGKNTAIVTGAMKIAKIPVNKPENFRKIDLTKSTKEVDISRIYDQLVKEVAKEKSSKKGEESPIQNLAKARMLKKLNSNWNVVSINRLPNFEKYVIILEISLNSRGNIIGTIKTVYPKFLKGNFLIAERSAINAVKESVPFQVPKDIFPNGLILRVVFDPKTNIGANNG